MSDKRLIEVAFPLEQTSIDSVHEKNVRHGHISTLHIWPARRPLAAARAALIATLLPDPGTKEARDALVKRMGGEVVKVVKRHGGEEKIVKETRGGILHWGRETTNQSDLDFFRQEIRKAYGGRAPRVLDPFAGGGAIPLEAMRLGCEVTAIDINPVAWFILKCTLEYPHKLAGQKRPLPEFVRSDRAFMEAFFKAQGMKGAMLRTQLQKLGLEDGRQKPGRSKRRAAPAERQTSLDLQIEGHTLDADLAWHVRAWGWWVLREARKELAQYYPVYADWQPLKDVANWRQKHPNVQRPMQQVPLRDDGTPDVDALNADLTPEQLADERQPRWVAKPTVAYLWARTVTCKHCRATIPLLKTRWLAKKPNKRVLLTMEPNSDRTGVVFGIQNDVPLAGGNNAQRREHDKRIGQGTMSRAGAWCPCCGKPGTVAMSMEDIRTECAAKRVGAQMTSVIIDGAATKEYRSGTKLELDRSLFSESDVQRAFVNIPFGQPHEPLPPKEALGIRVALYGMNRWSDLFSQRQLAAIATFVRVTRASHTWRLENGGPAHDATAFLALAVDRLADYSSAVCSWHVSREIVRNTFARFALPMVWDFAEVNPLGATTGGYAGGIEWIARFMESGSATPTEAVTALPLSALKVDRQQFDAVVTDPPYYDAIPYSDLMDFFYVWLRRVTSGLNAEWSTAFENPLGPKWNHHDDDGELVDESSRHDGDSDRSKQAYERGMARAFSNVSRSLAPGGRMVVVFANKQPAAWETLVNAVVRAGFTVTGSWPIRTEMGTRQRALSASALASSVWLVCTKRPPTAKSGWDNTVMSEMRENISQKLRDFWDAGIHGPDFVWAATGPALEAFSKHPVVKKADNVGETMAVGEFLTAVRRIVVEFVVGRVLTEKSHAAEEVGSQVAATLDDVTTYYLLHRNDFGMQDAPAGACILYALSCNLRENDLADRYDLLARTGGTSSADEDDEDEPEDAEESPPAEGSGSTFKLKSWKQRRRPSMGFDPVADAARQRQREFEALGQLFEDVGPAGTPAGARPKMVPLIDSVHRLMHLWNDGDVAKVNDYLDSRGLRRSETFRQVLQALIEIAGEESQGSEEHRLLESLSNHVRVLGERPASLIDIARN